MPKPRIHLTNAARQKAYRERHSYSLSNYERLEKAIIDALDSGRAHRLADNLPEELNARCEALVSRLQKVALVVFPPRHKRDVE